MTIGRRLLLAMALLAFAAGTTPADGATVQVYSRADNTTLAIGQTTTVSVFAQVTDLGAVDYGLFTFDLDLIMQSSSVLSFVPGSVTRPDSMSGGSVGTIDGDVLQAVAGMYSDRDRGLLTPQTLFTVQVRAEDQGSCEVSPGPDTDIMGVDFMLQTSSGSISYMDPDVYYGGIDAIIHVIPEPATVGMLCIGGLGVLGRRRRTNQRAR